MPPYRPASQGPLQEAVLRPAVLPYSPALQLLHTPSPVKLYLPNGHINAVAVVEPAAHAYPAVQLPVQAGVDNPAVLPYKPTAQLVHAPAPLTLNLPTGHMNAVPFVEPLAQAYPAVQLSVQPGVVSPDEMPYTPALQFVQTPAPARLYVLTGHSTTVPFVEPAGQL